MNPEDQERIVRECSRLALAFAIHVDFGQAQACADLFTEDGTFERKGEILRGREEILAAQRARPPGLRTRHFCQPTWVTVIDESNAEGITYFANYRHEADAPLSGPAPLTGPGVVGEFHDRFVLTPQGWRIASRRAKAAFRRMA
ncbi:MAG: nuclear transport factor 2 family protein [Burkholderiales bacterium]|nr:nuclear transport factor 2 family protein [Burkholderiales bacterium]